MSAATQQQPETRMITAAEFKAKCLQLMDEVNEKQLTLVITKRGKPVMEASAPRVEAKPFRSLFGRSRGGAPISDTALAKSKAKFTEEWDRSTERLAAMMRKSDKRKGTKK